MTAGVIFIFTDLPELYISCYSYGGVKMCIKKDRWLISIETSLIMTYPLEEYIGNIDQLCNFISQRYYKLIDGRTENSLSTGSQFFS